MKISYIRYEIDTDDDRSIGAQLLKIDEKSEKETSVLGTKRNNEIIRLIFLAKIVEKSDED